MEQHVCVSEMVLFSDVRQNVSREKKIQQHLSSIIYQAISDRGVTAMPTRHHARTLRPSSMVVDAMIHY